MEHIVYLAREYEQHCRQIDSLNEAALRTSSLTGTPFTITPKDDLPHADTYLARVKAILEQ